MPRNTMYEGEGIKTFIPQREPMLMVDALYQADDTSVDTGLTIAKTNIFCDEEGNFSESGVIEHIAQSAAVFAGYNDWKNGRPIVLGYIAEIKKFSLLSKAKIGDKLESSLKTVSQAMNITLMDAETKIGDNTVAKCKIKIFMDKK
mgnify:CR=1 FL=1